MKHLMNDERTIQLNGMVSFACLMLTQLALAGVILYKRYILGMDPGQYADLLWITGCSIGLYWAGRLYLSGVLPVIRWKKALLIYAILVAVISIPTYFIHGWPERARWFEVLYPLIGVAVVLVVYSLIAYFGKQRLEHLGEE